MSSRGASTHGSRKASTTADKAVAKAAAKAKVEAALTRAVRARANRTTQAIARLYVARERNPTAFRGRTSLMGIEPAAAKTLQERIEMLRNMPTERGLIIDAKTGQLLVDRTSKNVGTISLNFRPQPGYPRGERDMATGNVWVHNHPPLSPHEGREQFPTFSDEDYTDNRGRLHPSVAVVVSKPGIALMQSRRDGTWPAYAAEVKPALDRAFAAYDKSLSALAASVTRSGRSDGGSSVRGNRSLMSALNNLTNGDLMHLAWRDAAKQTGLRYSLVRDLPTTTKGRRGRR